MSSKVNILQIEIHTSRSFENADKACCIIFIFSVVVTFGIRKTRIVQVPSVRLTMITDLCTIWISDPRKKISLFVDKFVREQRY